MKPQVCMQALAKGVTSHLTLLSSQSAAFYTGTYASHFSSVGNLFFFKFLHTLVQGQKD